MVENEHILYAVILQIIIALLQSVERVFARVRKSDCCGGKLVMRSNSQPDSPLPQEKAVEEGKHEN